MWKPLLDSKFISIYEDFTESKITLDNFNQLDLFLILNNFILNSAYYLEEKDFGERRINISLVETQNSIILELSNNGKELSERYKTNPNYILKPGITTKPENEGTGLGLWILNEAVERNGGRTEVIADFEGFKIKIIFSKQKVINIGIVEDKESELENIKRTFYSFYKENCDFQDYIIDEYGKKEELVNEILDDISSTRIDALVVDYLISTEGFKIEGNEIYESVKKHIQNFPVVILTQYVDDSQKSEIIDPDKVYRKSIFFDINTQKSKDSLKNIDISIRNFQRQKEEIEQKIVYEQQKIRDSEIDSSVLINLSELEFNLNKYRVSDNATELDKLFDISQLECAVKLIKDLGEL